eukprot:CAMPEP_0183522264 /NCGR_PEP_ID=MMETSP0371-20130417/18298_1 /TAXON_ID=268820 /ORGANISM="Peridinium aciculiferum, Strain PAER-2" /LENGTH=88 /DNA_ID=CAMNT_0025720993 /DNA_START=654 /DNA_END=917 /DNA_ORIENTATION=-
MTLACRELLVHSDGQADRDVRLGRPGQAHDEARLVLFREEVGKEHPFHVLLEKGASVVRVPNDQIRCEVYHGVAQGPSDSLQAFHQVR